MTTILQARASMCDTMDAIRHRLAGHAADTVTDRDNLLAAFDTAIMTFEDTMMSIRKLIEASFNEQIAADEALIGYPEAEPEPVKIAAE